jgi:hypothetical protein
MGRFIVFTLILFITLLTGVSIYSCAPAPYIYITDFEVTPNPITQGGTAILRWNVTGATIIEVNNGIGAVPPYGNLEIKPGQTTEYVLTANNSSMSSQKSVTIVVDTLPVTTAPRQIELPIISALDTEKLLSMKGQEAQVEGDITYISSWLPDRFTGQGTTRPWTFIFFMNNIWEGYADNANSGGTCSPECWRDYTSYFRAVIKPDYFPVFYSYLPGGYVVNEQMPIVGGGASGTARWYSSTGALISSPGFTLQEPMRIVLKGTIEGYLSAPAIYLTDVNQILTVKR